MRNKDAGRVREVNMRVHEVNMKQVWQWCEVSKYQRVLAT